MATTLLFLPGKFHARWSLAGYSPWGWKHQTRLSTHTNARSLVHEFFEGGVLNTVSNVDSRFLINICRIKEFRMKIEIKVEIKIADRHRKIISYQEHANLSPMKYPCIPTRIAELKKKNWSYQVLDSLERNWSFYICWWECKLLWPLRKTIW